MKIMICAIFIFSFAMGTQAEDCSELIDDCSFYACIENEVSCGEKGYPVSFGQKYCLKFEKRLEKFSPRAQKWMHETQSCLTQKLFDSYNDQTCKELKKQAFKDHLECYYKSGFCSLSVKDKKRIFVTAKSSLWKWRVIKTGFKLIYKCIKNK